jgi:hypothetical protein
MAFEGSISSLLRKAAAPKPIGRGARLVRVRPFEILSTDSYEAEFFQLQGELSLWLSFAAKRRSRAGNGHKILIKTSTYAGVEFEIAASPE